MEQGQSPSLTTTEGIEGTRFRLPLRLRESRLVRARPGKQNHHASGIYLRMRTRVIVGDGRATKPQKGELEDKQTPPAGFPVALRGTRTRWLRACLEGTSGTSREGLQRQDPAEGAARRGNRVRPPPAGPAFTRATAVHSARNTKQKQKRARASKANCPGLRGPRQRAGSGRWAGSGQAPEGGRRLAEGKDLEKVPCFCGFSSKMGHGHCCTRQRIFGQKPTVSGLKKQSTEFGG